MSDINIKLHPRQGEALLSEATEILYGGAAGGGKSHLMRVMAIIMAVAVAGLQIYIFRRTSPDLIKNHLNGPSGFLILLNPLIKSGHCKFNGKENTFKFWNGAIIWLCHCQHEKDMYNYQGAEIHVLLMDELTHFTETIYKFLRGRVRLGGLQVPEQYKNKLPMVLCGSNPGNIGHMWVKAAWVDRLKPMEIKRMSKKEGGMLRQYIPAKLNDNPTLLENDPDYADRLAGLGSETLVAAMLDGSWDIVDGAYFDEFDREVHVMKPFHIPLHWARLMSMDWGYTKPFCVLWAAVSDGTYRLDDGSYIPKDALIVYREWYGSDGEPDVGLKMPPAEAARGILERSGKERFAKMVADPAIWGTQTGESVAEMMAREGVRFHKADNNRFNGWMQVHSRLKGDRNSDEKGKPLLYFFDTCRHLIRTLPALMHDQHKVEDVDTTMEDHAPDTLRYMCMARPRPNAPKKD